jgi:nucleoside-diphosphate-sugar epimerase
MHHHSTVLILGARGRFGQAAARAFTRAGWQVFGQMRPNATSLPIAGVKWLALDPSDTAALVAAVPDASVVINALNPKYTHKAWRAEALDMLNDAIRLGQALNATLMLPGNVYNFGKNMPALLRADSNQESTGVKGLIRIAMEQRLHAATQEGKFRAVVIRAGDYFGSGTGSWLDQAIAKDLKKGRITWPAGLDIATPWAYLPDLADACVKVAVQRDQLAAFSRLHFAGHTVTGQQWVDVLSNVAREQGWLAETGTLRVNAMPWALFRVLGPLLPTFAALAEMQYLWRTPHQLDNRELCSLIGEEPRTAFEEAVRLSLYDLGLTVKVQGVRA